MDAAAALERQNLAQIERLNQRGRRTLSIADLIAAGTINPEMAALCWLMVEGGASLLTGAVPGGAGKTTLMAALLSFLPPGERIATVSGPEVLRRVERGGMPGPTTLLAHEIGSGHWFGYIWGRQAARFFAAWRHGARRVTCLHSDDPEQTAEALRALGVADQDLAHVALQLYMRVSGGWARPLRRVASLHARLAGRLRALYRWRAEDDALQLAMPRGEVCALLADQGDGDGGDLNRRWREREEMLAALAADGPRDYADVRWRIVEHGAG